MPVWRCGTILDLGRASEIHVTTAKEMDMQLARIPMLNQSCSPFDVLDEFLWGKAAAPATRAAEGRLPLDVYEEGSALHVEVEVPGISEADLDIQVFEGLLTIRSDRTRGAEQEADSDSAEKTVEGRNYFVRERADSTVKRAIRLPFEVKEDEVSAELEDGVLHVQLPKAESAQPRRISVQATPKN